MKEVRRARAVAVVNRKAVEKEMGRMERESSGGSSRTHGCRSTGFAGRLGLYELLVVDDEIRAQAIEFPDFPVAEHNVVIRIAPEKALRHGFDRLYQLCLRFSRRAVAAISVIVRLGVSSTNSGDWLKLRAG